MGVTKSDKLRFVNIVNVAFSSNCAATLRVVNLIYPSIAVTNCDGLQLVYLKQPLKKYPGEYEQYSTIKLKHPKIRCGGICLTMTDVIDLVLAKENKRR